MTELRDEETVLRGASYWDQQPFTFLSPYLPHYYDEVSREVSFRVVIEDNRW